MRHLVQGSRVDSLRSGCLAFEFGWVTTSVVKEETWNPGAAWEILPFTADSNPAAGVWASAIAKGCTMAPEKVRGSKLKSALSAITSTVWSCFCRWISNGILKSRMKKAILICRSGFLIDLCSWLLSITAVCSAETQPRRSNHQFCIRNGLFRSCASELDFGRGVVGDKFATRISHCFARKMAARYRLLLALEANCASLCWKTREPASCPRSALKQTTSSQARNSHRCFSLCSCWILVQMQPFWTSPTTRLCILQWLCLMRLE